MVAIHVAVGVVFGPENTICITRRPHGKHLAGYWEFPGGKVEAGENVRDALTRELEEEIGITVVESEKLTEIAFSYPEKSVLLDVLMVHSYSGTAAACESQELRWVAASELDDYQFPEANREIIAAIHERIARS